MEDEKKDDFTISGLKLLSDLNNSGCSSGAISKAHEASWT